MPRLVERFSFSGGRVDRTGSRPVVRGVLLCGATSANRRRYKAEAFAGDQIKKYEGRPIFVGHSKGDRHYGEQLGWIRNPRQRADGMPIGDIEVKKHHPLAEQFLDDAEHDPSACGMSHVCHADPRRGADGWDEISHIEKVESVDVVLDAATTTSLFENHTGRTTVTLSQLIERLATTGSDRQRRAARALREEAYANGVMDAPAPENAGITAAFKAACAAIITKAFDDKSQINSALSKLRKMLTTHSIVTDDDDDTDDDTSGDDEGEAAGLADTESRRGARVPTLQEIKARISGGDPAIAEMKARWRE